MDISLKNYRKGLITGQSLSFQTNEFYEKNKNNFCNSLREKYPDRIPNYAKKINPDGLSYEITSIRNYLAFNPDDLLRFGVLDTVKMDVKGVTYTFWVVRMPSGFSLYHSSRSLALSHSNFPLPGYKNKASYDFNLANSQTMCPTNLFVGTLENKGVCTRVSYYSTPALTKGYLNKDSGYGGNAIKYAYGITPHSSDKDNKLYNDRLRYNVKIKDNVVIRESMDGISAYKGGEMTLMILGIDDILIDRPNFGKENMRNFYNIMEALEDEIRSENGLSKADYDYFMNLIISVSGIGSLQDNINVIKSDYPRALDFDKALLDWISRNVKYYSENPLPTAGKIREFNLNPDNIPGFRFSTYEHDRPVINQLSWLFNQYESSVVGVISSSLYVYSKGKGDITKQVFNIGELSFYTSKGYFHSEVGLFYAPSSLERDRRNKYDTEYGMNYLGILTEYRKFKTSNSFHSGNLLEHNTWVALVASQICKNYTHLGSDFAKSEVYLLAGLLHDIGKAGRCVTEPVYKNQDAHAPSMSVCNYVKDENSIVGCEYDTIPDHPDIGYMYLEGYKNFFRYTLNGLENKEAYNENSEEITKEDWQAFYEHLGIPFFESKLISVTVGAHWYFGDFLRKVRALGLIEKDAEKLKLEISQLSREYLRKVEMFYNDLFADRNREDFRKCVLFTVIVSMADVYGSEYNPYRSNLSDFEQEIISNYLPNVSLSNISYETNTRVSEIVTKIIEKSESNAKADFKAEIINGMRAYGDGFLEVILNEIGTFEFNPRNTFGKLRNLQESTPVQLKEQNGEFPPVIVFDLDQTLIYTTFYPNREVEYHIYPSTYEVIAECQKLREKGVKIAVASRHYAPKTLLKLFQAEYIGSDKNPLYYSNFDFIVSRYTGTLEKLKSDVSSFPGFFDINGVPEDGFIMDSTGQYFNVPSTNKFLKIGEISKNGHFDLIKRKFGVNYEDIILFDDDRHYFSSEGLGDANVFSAGVLVGHNKEDQGIRYSLFRDALALYIFQRFLK